MEVAYYTDKSIAVFGETKPWSENLKQLGGKYNPNLQGRPGWIFSRTKENEVLQFVNQANQGLVQPITNPYQQQRVNQPPMMVPFGATKPAFTPQAALTTLKLNQPQTTGLPQIQPIVMRPTGIIQPTIQPVIQPIIQSVIQPTVMRPASPQRLAVLPSQPATVNYPNMFIAGDGLNYQIIIYTVPVPTVGQRVTLTVGNDNLEYVVSAVQKTSAPFDDILITQAAAIEPATEPETSRAIIMNGKWQIHCMQDDHSLVFHAL
jgi:hypothetical protein